MPPCRWDEGYSLPGNCLVRKPVLSGDLPMARVAWATGLRSSGFSTKQHIFILVLHVQHKAILLLVQQYEDRRPVPEGGTLPPSARPFTQEAPLTNESLISHLHWASLLLRLSIGTLFLCAAIVKAHLGIPGTIGYYSWLFEKSLLPHFLVTAHASVIIFTEFGLAFWLFSGFQLELAWKIAALLLLSLAIGMIFAGKYDVASDNYVYVFLCIAGLLTSSFDRLAIKGRA